MVPVWLVLLASALGLLVAFFKHSFGYWRRLGVPSLPASVPSGSVAPLLLGRASIGDQVHRLYADMKRRDWRFGGLYFLSVPTFMPLDPDLIEEMLTTRFGSFHDRGIYANEEDPSNLNLFALKGEKWRLLRLKLGPTFTSGKMKLLFAGMQATAEEMCQVAREKLLGQDARPETHALRADSNAAAGTNHGAGHSLDMYDLASRYAISIIGRCVFGTECHPMRDPSDTFAEMAFRLSRSGNILQQIKFFLCVVGPTVAERLKLKPGDAQVFDFFRQILLENSRLRRELNVERMDFLQILIKLMDDKERGLSLDEAAAQAFVFFVAGFETSSSTITFCLYELAQQPQLQERLRKEISACSGMGYEEIARMPYLDMVICETLRKYPPLPFLNRMNNDPYTIPGSGGITLPKNTPIYISVRGLSMDPDHFPQPENFDPERFSEERKSSFHPYAYIPFGEGRRICIGKRFGVLQVKLAVAMILRNFRVTLDDRTDNPMTFAKESFGLSPAKKVYMKLQPVDE